MAENQESKKIAVKEGVYRLPGGNEPGHLIGTRCMRCGSHFYPSRKNCAVCFSEDIEEVALSSRGKIYRFTVIRQNYPGSALTPPYIAAQVELPEQVYITTLLTGVEFDEVRIGMDVECFFFTLKQDEKKQVIAFAFRPIPAEQSKP